MNNSFSLNCTTMELRKKVARVFPAYQYHGDVMAERHDPAVYESDEDNLDLMLGGKTWTDVDPRFVEINEDDYLLMSGPAAAAFMAAWLWRAAEDLDRHNSVRDAFIYHLARLGGSKAEGTGFWARGFKFLNKQQCDLIYLLLECAAKLAPEEDRDEIAKALKSIEANVGQPTFPL